MATRRHATGPSASAAVVKYACWFAALVGLWVLASPFLLPDVVPSAAGLVSNVLGGLLVAAFGTAGGYAVRSAARSESLRAGELTGYVAGVAGLWVAVTPFLFARPIAAGLTGWSNVVAGTVVVVLAAFTGYALQRGP